MLFVSDVSRAAIDRLLLRYDLELVQQPSGAAISGSFWGDSEAGIIGRKVYVRPDTPIHSMLHEASHVICMTADRRMGLDRDAGGDDLEESAVCYLQVVLADYIEGVGRARLMRDMDAWGYSFRLGNTRDWFQNDAEDAVEFLKNHGLLNAEGKPTFQLRQ
ncbi:MAG: hypothetical protein GWP67_04850 [Gammaproteobacteria bacterium]|jgi:hypothetical protein|nr:hypothetical protein [Gammaproteobacteria bacterium]